MSPDQIPFLSRRTPVDQQQYSIFTPTTGDMQPATDNPAETTSYPVIGVIEDMLNTPAQLNWVSFFPSDLFLGS